MNLSRSFTFAEMTASATADQHHIPNRPSTEDLVNLCALCHNVLQPLRDAMQEPVKIGSGYRSPALNTMVGGVTGSQHTTGQAADLCIDGDLNKARRWFNYIRDYLTFDQLILEHNAKGSYWVHVSYRLDGHNRKQVIPDLLKK